VAADEGKIRQVLTNLVANAVEASGPHGTVAIDIRPPGPGQVAVNVRDTGPGVSAADRAHIFEPFFTTKPQGTGLGLAISRAIAKAHGGDLVLIDDGPPGATFALTLPPAVESA
jgi:signal transduction histidine kinase